MKKYCFGETLSDGEKKLVANVVMYKSKDDEHISHAIKLKELTDEYQVLLDFQKHINLKNVVDRLYFNDFLDVLKLCIEGLTKECLESFMNGLNLSYKEYYNLKDIENLIEITESVIEERIILHLNFIKKSVHEMDRAAEVVINCFYD